MWDEDTVRNDTDSWTIGNGRGRGKGEGEGKEGQDPDRVRDTDIIAGDRSEYLNLGTVEWGTCTPIT